MALQDEIDRRRRAIKTDSYSMSIGELMNLYQSNELDLHPDFQRFFRWTDEQKTKLIESILLGIPLPPVFVAQRSDGVWDVIDGLQRLSAIFQFGGILIGSDGAAIPPLTLTKAKYLPSLLGKQWENKANPESLTALTTQQRIDIKRSKLDVNIILRESNADAKYDMFERLNTGGTQLSEQEVRNCLLLMSSKPFFAHLEEMAAHPAFLSATALTDRARDERYDMELVVRFITMRTTDPDQLRGLVDVNTFLTDKILELAESDIDIDAEVAAFKATFDMLDEALSDNSFRRYNAVKQRFMGGFLVSVYEVVAMGVGHNINTLHNNQQNRDRIFEIVKNIWDDREFTGHQGSGVRGTDRIPHTIPLGRRLFS